jgi:hypothetical protein
VKKSICVTIVGMETGFLEGRRVQLFKSAPKPLSATPMAISQFFVLQVLLSMFFGHSV